MLVDNETAAHTHSHFFFPSSGYVPLLLKILSVSLALLEAVSVALNFWPVTPFSVCPRRSNLLESRGHIICRSVYMVGLLQPFMSRATKKAYRPQDPKNPHSPDPKEPKSTRFHTPTYTHIPHRCCGGRAGSGRGRSAWSRCDAHGPQPRVHASWEQLVTVMLTRTREALVTAMLTRARARARAREAPAVSALGSSRAPRIQRDARP